VSRKKGSGGKIAAGIAAAVVAFIAVLMAPAIVNFVQQQDVPGITILQPQGREPEIVAREDLVEHVLQVINDDRADFGLPPVELSANQAAQVHAEDVFHAKQISHWMTNGEKPYMTYSRYGGMGSVQQNVAIAGFTAEQYEECVSGILRGCERIDPLPTIEELEYEMMYKDEDCCGNGHRENILNPHHTDVSIGVVYDEYYLVVVQNFENNYGLRVSASNEQVRVSGQLAKGTLEQISIYYDEMPTPDTYEENKHALSYSAGELVASVAKPLPPGYYYEQQEGYSIIVANRWAEQGESVDVRFDLAQVARQDGVYTISAFAKDGEMFEVTSYSVFVKSDRER
jgi:uncharacterized protein YkwD